jgi:hypothetical protein
MQEPPTRNAPILRRRSIGLVVCVTPVILLLASIIFGLIRPRSPTSGLGWTIAALMFGLLNFYLSFVRPALFRWRYGSLERYRHVSGFPMVGTILVVVGGLVGFGSVVTASVGLVAMALDTGSSIWFVLATWKDRSARITKRETVGNDMPAGVHPPPRSGEATR